MRYPFPLNQVKSIALTGGANTWSLRELPLFIDGRPAHLVGLIFEMKTAWKQAATTGVAVRGVDHPSLVSQVSVARSAKRVRRLITGQSNRIFDAVRNSGDEVYPPPTDIAANGTGSDVTTQRTWHFPVWFESPATVDPFDLVWPTGAYIREGQVKLTTANPTTPWGATITLDSGGTNTVDIIAILETKDEVSVGIDLEAFNLSDTTTSGSSTTLIDPDDLLWFIYNPEKVNNATWPGGDTVLNVSSFDGGSYMPAKFPPLSAQFHIAQFLAMHKGAGGDNVVKANNCVPLVYPNRRGQLTAALRAMVQWRLKVTLSASLASGSQYIVARVLERDMREVEEIAAAYGIENVSNVWAPAGGRRVQEKNRKFVRMVLKPGHVAPANRGTRDNTEKLAS